MTTKPQKTEIIEGWGGGGERSGLRWKTMAASQDSKFIVLTQRTGDIAAYLVSK